MGLFDRVFRGSDEMFAKAEAEINAVVAELGESAPMKMPDTAYYLSCIYAYLGKKVTTLGELRDTLADVKAMMTREYKTKDIFTSGVGTAIAAEMIEACKYARNPDPYAGTNYHGHFTDAEVRTLGVPLVTRDIPGFVVMIGPAPTKEEALETGVKPLREFMYKQTQTKDAQMFCEIGNIEWTGELADIPTSALIPAFMVSELRTAFIIGFVIYIPFLVIDMVVASALMSMGMMMLPPTTISMPFKILLFVLADGWNLVIVNLVKTFYY